MKKWMKAIKAVKKVIAKKKYRYDQSAYTTNIVSAKRLRVRHDCSGYVSACIQYMGLKGFITSSYGFSQDDNIAKQLKALGFKKLKFTGWKDCKEGDIVSQSCSHVEIFSHYSDGIAYVYSNGSTSGMANPSYGRDGNTHKYDTVWRYVGKK